MFFLAEQSTHLKKNKYVLIGIVKNSDWSMCLGKSSKKVLIQMPSFWTFVTKYEFASNFSTPPTEESKLNHQVNT